MPELPEVETVCRGLAPHVEGVRIETVTLNRPDLRFKFPDRFVDRLQGQEIKAINRRAKYILMDLSGGETWLSHLGMTGNYRIVDNSSPVATGKHDHVEVTLAHPQRGACTLVYSDPRRFGFMDLFADVQTSKYLANLGPEPLGNHFTATGLAQNFSSRRTPVKSALLDQRIIAGLGNIYVCEALWRASIAPTVPVHNLVNEDGTPTPKLGVLANVIRDVLLEAIAAGGSTLQDFRNTDGNAGYFQHRFDVYAREGHDCQRADCSGTITRIVQSGRSSFWCPACQSETG